VGALQLMLDLGKDDDWFASTEIRVLAVTAAIGFAAFLIWELTEKHPIVNLRVFRHRGFTAAVVTISLGYGAMFAANVLTPNWLQTFMGYTATWAGLATAWQGALAVVVAPMVGVLISKFDPRRLVFGGLTWLALVTFFRAGATTDMGYWQIARPLMMTGLGLPFFFVPLTALALSSVEDHETASAAGLQNFLRTLSGAFATSLVTTAWDNKANMVHAEWVGDVDRMHDAARTLAASGMSGDSQLVALDRMLQGQSVMVATNEIMALTAALFLIAAFVVWFAPKPTRAFDMTKAGH
jgi:DHA2 family multidrug resistance protein